MMSLMIETNNSAPPTSKPTFSIGQMMLLIVWLGLVFSLIRASTSMPPKVYGPCSEIAVSDSGKHTAAIYYQTMQLFRNGKYVDRIELGQVDSAQFIDDETLVLVSLDRNLPGVHFYSIEQKKITSSFSLSPNIATHVVLLDDKFIVQQNHKVTGKLNVYEMSSTGAKFVSSHGSPHFTKRFDATNDGRYAAFYHPVVKRNFDTWDYSDPNFDYDLEKEEGVSSLNLSNGLKFSSDGSFLITCKNEITKIKWPSTEKLWSIPGEEPCGHVRISRGNDRFAVLTGEDSKDQDRFLRVYNSDSAEKLFELNLNEDLGIGYSFSGDGKSIWTASQDERGVLTQWDIASGSIVNQVGSSSRLKSVTFYALLFLLWSVAYVRLVPSRFPSPLKLGSRVILLPNAFLLVTAGCFFAFDSDSLTMMLSGVMILFGGNVNLVAVLRSLFGSAPEETDTASE